MAKRKRNPEPTENLEDREDDTRPGEGESELVAAVDQHDAEMRGEANEPPAEEAQIEKAEEPVDDGKPRVALRVFIASGGKKWDQMAGFKSYAKRLKMGPLSIPEWREAFDTFMNRPVG